MRWMLATVHLFALGIGLGAVWARSRALRGTPDRAAIARALTADAWWGIAALLWVVTGLWRLFGATEKSTAYYLSNHWFWTKMGLFLLILALETIPMITLIRWRNAARTGAPADYGRAAGISTASAIQAVLVLLMIVVATAMARGYGALP